MEELRNELVAKAEETGRQIDIDGIKAKASEHIETAKTATAETLADLQAQAESAYETASAKAEQLQDAAEDKYDELKAEAIEQLEVAQAKIDEIKAEATAQVAETTAKAKGFFSHLFGGK